MGGAGDLYRTAALVKAKRRPKGGVLLTMSDSSIKQF
jgi:hypothetical protein